MRRLAARLSYRTLGTAGVVIFALAGTATAYALPLATSHDDGWFAAHNGSVGTGLMLGLLLAYTGGTAVRLLTAPRKERKCHVDTTVCQAAARQGDGRLAQAGPPKKMDDKRRRQPPLQAVLPEPVPLPRRDVQQFQLPSCPRK